MGMPTAGKFSRQGRGKKRATLFLKDKRELPGCHVNDPKYIRKATLFQRLQTMGSVFQS